MTTNNAFKTRKLSRGTYSYRGWIIWRREDVGPRIWKIRGIEHRLFVRLRDAKHHVDGMFDEMAIPRYF